MSAGYTDLVGLVAVVGVFSVMIIGLIGVLLIAALKVLKGGSSRKSRVLEADETKLIQQIHAGLARMEQRVESLETLLLDAGKDTASAKKRD